MPYSIPIRIRLGEKIADEMNAVFDNLKRDISNFKPLWRLLKPLLAKFFQKRFDEESGPSGKWPPLDPKTLKTKRRKGYPFPDRILLATMRLYNACTQIGDMPTSDQVMIEEAKRFAFGLGEGVDYGYFHDREQGVRGKRREFLALGDDGIDELFSLIGKWTYRTAGRALKGKGAASQEELLSLL